MEESKKLPSCGTGTKNPVKGTNHGQKNKRDTAEADEDESQERVEEDATLFRACDDREIELNGLRKFSKNLKFDKPMAEDITPVRPIGATRECATRPKARSEAAESRQRSYRAREPLCQLVDMQGAQGYRNIERLLIGICSFGKDY